MSTPRYVLLTLGLTLFGMLFSDLLRYALPSAAVPNFALILVVFLAFYDLSTRGAVLAFCCGLLVDMYSGLLLGPNAGAAVFVYGVLIILSQRFFVDSPLTAFIAVAFSTFLNIFILALLVSTSEISPVYWKELPTVFLEAIVNGILAPLAFRVFRIVLLRSEKSSASKLVGYS